MNTYSGLMVYVLGTVLSIFQTGNLIFIKTLGRDNFYVREIKCACLRTTMTFELFKRKIYPRVENVKVQD